MTEKQVDGNEQREKLKNKNLQAASINNIQKLNNKRMQYIPKPSFITLLI